MDDQKKKSNQDYEQYVEVQIAENLLTASVRCTAIEEVNPAYKDVISLLEKKGVTYGILEEAVHSFVAEPSLYKEKELLVAQGTPAIHGEDAFLEMIYQQQESKTPKESDDGKVDFYQITNISNVEKGQLIAKKMPATEGTPGTTVTNMELKAISGKDIRVKVGKNVVLEPTTQALYAVISGQVSITSDEKINVFPIFEVNGDLDFEIGNIDFVGNVVIRGNVPTGFKIKAKGDVRITGSVEGAEIDAEGSITIQSGITAQHKGEVKAGRDLKTNFISNGNVSADGDVIVAQSIMHSNVIAGGSITCMGAKGLIVGGSIQAGKSVKCRTIGNMMATPTRIEVGANPKLMNRIREIQQILRDHSVTLEKTEQALKVLEQLQTKLGQLPTDKKELKLKLMNTKLKLDQDKDLLREELNTLQKEADSDGLSSIEVSSHVYQGSKLVFGKYIKYIKDNEQRMKYYLDQSEIVATPLM